MVSHTSTGEWQSFESRMRRKRAERLTLRAEIAAEAGCFDDARQCLDEARSIAPGLPAIAAAESLIAHREAPPPLPKAPAFDLTPATSAPVASEPVPSALRRKILSYTVAGAVLAILIVVALIARPRPTTVPVATTPLAETVATRHADVSLPALPEPAPLADAQGADVPVTDAPGSAAVPAPASAPVPAPASAAVPAPASAPAPDAARAPAPAPATIEDRPLPPIRVTREVPAPAGGAGTLRGSQ